MNSNNNNNNNMCNHNMVPPALSPYQQPSDGYITAATFPSSSPSYWSSSVLPEDGVSVSSSLTSTPEITDHQSFVDELFTTTSVDPTLFHHTNSSSTVSTSNQHFMYQQLMTPLLETSPVFQKTILYHQQQPTTSLVGVNHPYHSYTTSYQPTMSHNYTYYYDNISSHHTNYHVEQFTNDTTPPPPLPSVQPTPPPPPHPQLTTTTTKKESHSGHYPCSEPNCTKVFSRPYNLKSHLRTHTNEKPFECDYKKCGWKFSRIHDLKRHVLKHTGVQPHGCEFCHKRFARSDALKRHWKVDVHCSTSLKEYKSNHDGKVPTSNNNKKRKQQQ
jgi:uncharacterized Zn-finger protein